MGSPRADDTSRLLETVLSEFTEVFDGRLGELKGHRVHIQLKPDARPRFIKARPVPYAIKDEIGRELDRLVEQGVYQPISHSDWAAPIVPVTKSDGSIRICGDYKQTVNQAAVCDHYPLPKIEDLLATLNGGQKFTKLDLSQAYQQLVLDDESQRLLTINTHKGLYKPTRLQFGVHSASGMFQREMEKRLSHIPHTVCRVDDILITGATDENHLSNFGNANVNADCMSRLPINNNSDSSSITNTIHMMSLNHAPVTAEDVRTHTRRDPIMSGIPWTRLHIDYAGPFLGRMFLLVADSYSKLIEAFPMSNSTSTATIEKLRATFATHGIPEIIVSDNGTCFTSSEFKSFMLNNKIRHITSAPYHPSTNGTCFTSSKFKSFMLNNKIRHITSAPYHPSTNGTCFTSSEFKSFMLNNKIRHITSAPYHPSTNGTCFTSSEFKSFMLNNKIRHITSAPYHPSTNGAAEKTVQTFKAAMKKMTESSTESIATQVNRFLFTYRITLHSATGVSPAELLMNHKLNSTLKILKPNSNRTSRLSSEKLIQNRGSTNVRSFDPEDPVWARCYNNTTQKWVEGRITRRTGPVSFEVEINNSLVRRHMGQLRKRKVPNTPTDIEMQDQIEQSADWAGPTDIPIGQPAADKAPVAEPNDSVTPGQPEAMNVVPTHQEAPRTQPVRQRRPP